MKPITKKKARSAALLFTDLQIDVLALEEKIRAARLTHPNVTMLLDALAPQVFAMRAFLSAAHSSAMQVAKRSTR